MMPSGMPSRDLPLLNAITHYRTSLALLPGTPALLFSSSPLLFVPVTLQAVICSCHPALTMQLLVDIVKTIKTHLVMMPGAA